MFLYPPYMPCNVQCLMSDVTDTCTTFGSYIRKQYFYLQMALFSYGDFSTMIMLIMLNLLCSCGSTYIFTSFSNFPFVGLSTGNPTCAAEKQRKTEVF